MFATFQSNSLKRLCWGGKGKFLVHLLRSPIKQNACCYVNSSTIKAIAISLTRDGLGLKHSLEFDERKKVLVGSTKKIDIDYVRKNPAPNPSELK